MYTGVPSGAVPAYARSNSWWYEPPAALSLRCTNIVASPGSPTVWAAAGVPARPIVVNIPSAAAALAAATRREKFRKTCSLRVATEPPVGDPTGQAAARRSQPLPGGPGDGNSAHSSPSRVMGKKIRGSTTDRREFRQSEKALRWTAPRHQLPRAEA